MSDEEEGMEVVLSENPADEEGAEGEDNEAESNAIVACNENVQKLMDMLKPMREDLGKKYSTM